MTSRLRRCDDVQRHFSEVLLGVALLEPWTDIPSMLLTSYKAMMDQIFHHFKILTFLSSVYLRFDFIKPQSVAKLSALCPIYRSVLCSFILYLKLKENREAAVNLTAAAGPLLIS